MDDCQVSSRHNCSIVNFQRVFERPVIERILVVVEVEIKGAEVWATGADENIRSR